MSDESVEAAILNKFITEGYNWQKLDNNLDVLLRSKSKTHLKSSFFTLVVEASGVIETPNLVVC